MKRSKHPVQPVKRVKTLDSFLTKAKATKRTSVFEEVNPVVDNSKSNETVSLFESSPIIKVYGDGRCFFRCIAVSFYKELADAQRSESGWITNNELSEQETAKADETREAVVDLIMKEHELLSRLSINLPFILDRNVTKHYESIDERAKSMSRVSAFVGNLEILVTAFLLRRQIYVYQEIITGSESEIVLRGKFPTFCFEKHMPIKLINTEDKPGQPGHFNLLRSSTHSYKNISINKSFSEVVDQGLVECFHEDRLVQFKDLFHQCDEDHINQSESIPSQDERTRTTLSTGTSSHDAPTRGLSPTRHDAPTSRSSSTPSHDAPTRGLSPTRHDAPTSRSSSTPSHDAPTRGLSPTRHDAPTSRSSSTPSHDAPTRGLSPNRHDAPTSRSSSTPSNVAPTRGLSPTRHDAPTSRSSSTPSNVAPTCDNSALPSSTSAQDFVINNKHQPFPVNSFRQGGRDHKFSKGWYVDYPWLHYKSNEDGVVCYECMSAKMKGILSSSHQELAFTTTGFLNWKKAKEKFSAHSRSDMHKESILKNACLRGKSVISQLSDNTTKEHNSGQIALYSMFTSLLYLASQGNAIRGHDHKKGGYIDLLTLRSNDIPELNEWLKRSKPMTGWVIQNEMLKMMANTILRNVLVGVRAAKEFSVIVDETTDCSTKEQVSISVRSVGKQLDVKELFLGLYETSSTTSKSLTNLIKDTFIRCQLAMDDLRGQCYDGASNMKGINAGVQARISNIQPLAVYIHCCNHSLNLALQDTTRKIPLLRNALQWIHDTAKIINTSNRRSDFLDIVSDLDEDTPMRTPKTLCPTRWTVRTAAITSALRTYSAVIKMMRHLGNSGTDVSSVAKGLLSQYRKSETYLSLLIARDIFGPAEKLSLVLEGQSQTISGACKAAELTVMHLRTLRTEKQFGELWKEMLCAQTKHCLIPPPLTRLKKVPKRLEQTNNPSEPVDFRVPQDRLRKIYYEVIDLITNEVERRFLQPGTEKLKALETAIMRPVAEWTSSSEMRDMLRTYNINADDLSVEMNIFPRLFTSEPVNVADIVSRLMDVPEQSKMMFPLVLQLLKILLVVPATSATAERSFSTMKRVKSYLRSSMGQERLNHLCILSVYKEKVQQLDIASLVKEFSKSNTYRAQVFGF